MKNVNVCVFGSRGVEKTAIVLQYMRGKFTDCYCSTIEDHFKKVLKIGTKKIEMNIIDTTGQEDFQTMMFQHISCADGFIFVYSIDDLSSLDYILDMYNYACEIKGSSSVPCVIAAKNEELILDSIKVPMNIAQDKLKSMGSKILTVSTESGKNVKRLFKRVAKKLIKKQKSEKH